MIETSARVIVINHGLAQVEPSTPSGCNGCQVRSSCGVSGLAKYFSNNRHAIEVRCDASVQAGDEILLSMSKGDLLRSGLLAYVLPSVLMLAGAGVATSFGLGDIGAVLGACIGFATGFLLARLSGWTPRLLARRSIEHSSQGVTP